MTDEIIYERRFVTPEMAVELIRTQVPNRGLSSTSSAKYARDMAAREWKPNGESIKLNPKGLMIDGQHRMQGVIDAAKLAAAEPENYSPFAGIELTFALNVDDEARATMDIGRKRTVSDFMAHYGVDKAHKITPVVTWHLAFTKGNYVSASGRLQYQPTQAEIIHHWAENEDLFYTSALRGADTNRQKLGAATPSAVAYHVLREMSGDELADTFWDRLVDGANLTTGSPVLVLRNKLATHRYRREVHLALIFRAWNNWIDGKTVENMYFKQKVTNRHFPFPRDPNGKRNDLPEYLQAVVEDVD